MKKHILILIIMLSLGALSHAQLLSEHYEVTAEEGADSAAWSREMEQRFAEFNKVFCFDLKKLSAPLKVRVFADKIRYDAYIGAKLASSQPKPGAVYLHYRNPADCELVIQQGSAEAGRLVAHQAFVQFIHGFIPSPPRWIREGFAAYFTALVYNRETETLEYRDDSDWLEEAKRAAANPDTTLRVNESLSNAQAQALSWSVVSFFMADKVSPYYRALTDSFTVLDSRASAEENARAVYERLTRFTSLANLTRDYTAYLANKKSFTELMEAGQKAYTARDYTTAAGFFRQAAELKPGNYVPPYYLGLIAYEQKNYADAERFYQTAADTGATMAQVQYARGLNAAAAGKKDDAIRFLEEAARDQNYKARSEELISRLR